MTHEKTKIWLAVLGLLASVPAFVLGMAMIAHISNGKSGIFWGAAYGILLSSLAGISVKALLEELAKKKKPSRNTLDLL